MEKFIMLKTLSSDLRKIIKSKNLREMFENVKFIHIELLAFISIFLYLASPVSQIISCLFSNIIYGVVAVYYETILVANRIAGILGTVAIILFIGKNIFAGYKFRDLVKNNIPMVFFSIFIILMFISTCINGFTEIALKGEIYRRESIFNYMEYFCIYFFCTSFIDSRKLKATAEYLFIICSIILGIVSIVHINITPVQNFINAYGTSGGLGNIFHNSNHYGYYLAMAISLSGSLFVLEKNKVLKVLCMINYIINIYVLSENNTFGAFVACLFGMIFYIIVMYICNKNINILSVVVFVIFIAESALFSDNLKNNILVLFGDLNNIIADNEKADYAGTKRWKLWELTCKYISEKPFFGFGVDGIYDRLYNEFEEYRSHNEFLQYASFFGIPAGVMYVCGVFSVFLKGLKHKHELDCYTIPAIITAFTYLVSSFFGNSFFYTAPFLFIFLGLGFAPPKHK